MARPVVDPVERDLLALLNPNNYPHLRSASEWTPERREVSLTIEQVQPDAWPTFRLPLVIQMSGPDARRYSVELRARKQVFRFKMRHAPARIEIDPDGDLLKRLES